MFDFNKAQEQIMVLLKKAVKNRGNIYREKTYLENINIMLGMDRIYDLE
jgi:hypothetical protein